jgi:hypothetical protein
MRPFLDDLDEFDISDSARARARRLYEKQRRKDTRLGIGRSSGPRHKHHDEDYEEYDDYNEDEFDSYARVHQPY